MDYFDLLKNTSLLFGDFGDKSKYISSQRYSKYFSTPSNVLDIIKNKSGVTTQAIIIDENAIDKNPNKKRILMKPTEDISVGDLITVTDWDSSNWLCTNRDPDDVVRSAGIIQKTNNILTFEISDVSYEYNCILIDKTSGALDINKYLVLEDGQILVIVKKDSYTETLVLDQRFVFNNKYIYYLTKINELTQSQSGLFYFTMKISEKSTDDDLDNNLPDDTVISIPDDSYI
jgi:hypothetical protein